MGRPNAKKAKKRTFKQFLKAKDINVSAKTYFVDAMGGMAQGLFASLLVGTILSTLAKYIGMIDSPFFATLWHVPRRERKAVWLEKDEPDRLVRGKPRENRMEIG